MINPDAMVHKKLLEQKTGFKAEEMMLIEVGQFEEDEQPYYYLFTYRGKRYKYIFGKLVEDKND